MTTTSFLASSGDSFFGAVAANRMTTKIDPAENGIRSPRAPRWAPNVVVGGTAYPSEMERSMGQATIGCSHGIG